jgi:hypothetical protein
MLGRETMESVARDVNTMVFDDKVPYLQAVHTIFNRYGIPTEVRGIYINQIPSLSRKL